MNVSAIIVTRGDVDLTDSIHAVWKSGIRDIVVWDNGNEWEEVTSDPYLHFVGGYDLSVYGRYAAIEHAKHELIYVQDDDCVVSDPQALVRAWIATGRAAARVRGEGPEPTPYHVVCNMPPEFRHGFYEEHSLVGFGAVFHRDAPFRAFQILDDPELSLDPWFHRTCDVAFTALTPRVLVDIPKTNLSWADAPDRMYRHPEHQAERGRMLELAFRAKDAADA